MKYYWFVKLNLGYWGLYRGGVGNTTWTASQYDHYEMMSRRDGKATNAQKTFVDTNEKFGSCWRVDDAPSYVLNDVPQSDLDIVREYL